MENQQSDAYKLVQLVYKRSWKATGKSWDRLNHGLDTAVILAMNVGLNFNEDDFAEMYKTFNGGYWFTGATGGEHFYQKAIELGHQQAISSFEKWKGRRPMVVEGVRCWIGRSFIWQGTEVIVTSFKDKDEAIIACTYKKINHYYGGACNGEGSPTKRFTIKWADLKEIRKRIGGSK